MRNKFALLPALSIVAVVHAASYSCDSGKNNAWIKAEDFQYLTSAFCSYADGALIYPDFPFSNTYDVNLTPRNGNPATLASISFSVSNTKNDQILTINSDNCYSILAAFGDTTSSCYGSSNMDTKGGKATDGAFIYTGSIHPGISG
ncbi:hypothetical protein MBLNU459_g8305t1 [Dothideomycetes sp. NU459]